MLLTGLPRTVAKHLNLVRLGAHRVQRAEGLDALEHSGGLKHQDHEHLQREGRFESIGNALGI